MPLLESLALASLLAHTPGPPLDGERQERKDETAAAAAPQAPAPDRVPAERLGVWQPQSLGPTPRIQLSPVQMPSNWAPNPTPRTRDAGPLPFEPWAYLASTGSNGSSGLLEFPIQTATPLSMGPELSWFQSDAPRRQLPDTTVLTPGWCFWYALQNAPIALGLSTSARFVLTEQATPVVDLLTSQARFALLLR